MYTHAEGQMTSNSGVPVDVEGFRAAMRQAGVEEVVDLTLEVYVEEASRLFSDLSTAIQEGDPDTVRAAAHSLKSSSGNIWALKAAALFATMEAAAADHDTVAMAATFEELQPEFRDVMAYLADLATGE